MTARKANQPTLTREDIVAAALALVDRDGLVKLSMRRLAAELGMSPMSLYYHVPDKSALYDLILDAVMSEVDLSRDNPTDAVQDRVIGLGYALRQALLAHPNTVQLALSRPLHTPAQLRPVEAFLGILFEEGLSATDAMGVVNIVGQCVFGTAAAFASQSWDRDMKRDYEQDIAAITPERFPMVTRAMTEAEPGGFDKDFDRGLRALVRGLLG